MSRAERIQLLEKVLGLLGVQVFWHEDGYCGWNPAARQATLSSQPVVCPRSAAEVQMIVREAARLDVPLVPCGGGTGLSGGALATSDELVVSMGRMNGIVSFDAIDRTITVQAGVVTQVVQDLARERGLFYPVDFASRGSSQVGGNIATNAGGVKVLRYGLTRNWVAGLKVVTGTGELLDLNKGLVKNATGYDLRHLFVGSEGTLGVVVEATLQLIEPPRPQRVAVLGLPSFDAVMDVFLAMRRQLALSAFEFFTHNALRHVVAGGGRPPFGKEFECYVLAEFDEKDSEVAAIVFEECCAAGSVGDGVLSQSESQSAELWRLREGISDSLARHRPYKNDISVRVSQMPMFLTRASALFAHEYPGFDVVWFGHIGDGNLHINVLPPPDAERADFTATCSRVTHQLGLILQEFGGSVSAEHGIGLLKKAYLCYSRTPSEIELMRRMKLVFDPAGILNPGKLLP